MAYSTIDLRVAREDVVNRSDALVRYYNDIKNIPLVNEEEEKALFELIKTGNEQERLYARNKIIESNQRFVVAVARRFANDENLMDLIDEGNLGMIEAIDDFDPSKGNRFLSFAVHYIHRAINIYNRANNAMVKRTNISLTFNTLSQATNKFVQENERQPSPEELMELLNNEYNLNLKDTRDLTDISVSSIDNFTSDNGEDGIDASYYDYNRASAVESGAVNFEMMDFNSKLVEKLLSTLKERDAKVVRLLFGIGRDRPLEIQEVAKEMGLTTERVRQIKVNSINSLKEVHYAMITSNL